MYPRILIPTDGGACSGEVIAQGVAIARAMGSSVVFLFVMDGMSSRREGVVTVADAVRTLSVHGQAILQSAEMTATAAGVAADGELVEGSPPDVIVERSVDFDLVVMGSHGRGLLKQLVLGSVTQDVLHRIARPMLVVRCSHDRAGRG